MKRRTLKCLALLLATLLLLSALAGCGGAGKKMITLGEHSLSVNTFQLMLSIQKGNMAYTIAAAYGDYNSEEFWGTVIDESSTTFNDYYTYAIFEKAKHTLAAVTLFDELSLSLPKSTLEKIDGEIDTFIEVDGEGSKQKLNAILAEYGANVEILREYKIMEAKVAALAEHLYGTDGSKIGVVLKDTYFEENYVAFKQILLSNMYYEYQTDKNGDVIYFNDNGTIAYDTEKGTAKLEGDKLVYYTEDGKIAYDTVNGKPSFELDTNGNPKTAKYTTAQMLDRLDLAISLRDIAEGESAETFDSLRKMYSDEEFGVNFDADALCYVATSVDYQSISEAYSVFDKLADGVSGIEVGDLAIVQTDAGIHLVRRYPLESGAYADKENSQWFIDTTYYVYDFVGNMINRLLSTRLEEYETSIEVDLELLGSVSLKDAVPNYDFR